MGYLRTVLLVRCRALLCNTLLTCSLVECAGADERHALNQLGADDGLVSACTATAADVAVVAAAGGVSTSGIATSSIITSGISAGFFGVVLWLCFAGCRFRMQ